MQVLILNGPNLNRLADREEVHYGAVDFTDFLSSLRARFPHIEIVYRQSNHEGDLIDWLQEAQADGVVLNAGAYSHSSLALRDCLAYIKIPIVEVHISNIHNREPFRQRTYTGRHCKGVITGLGLEGYALALHYFSQNT